MKYYKTTTLTENGEKLANVTDTTSYSMFRLFDITLDQSLRLKLLCTLLVHSYVWLLFLYTLLF